MPDIKITLTLPNQKTVCGKVIYLQSKDEPWLQSSLDLDIHCTEPLQPGVYEVVVTDGAEPMSGQYYIHDYEEADTSQGWLFFGTFAHVLTAPPSSQ